MKLAQSPALDSKKPPSPLPSPSQSCKRLFSGCPKPNRSTASETMADDKKTRKLPNLSECHACGIRIDICSGKNSLQVLYSEWRIVLLCKNCISSVESSQICSYCFKETTLDVDCFQCCQCKRCVHINCFSNYRTVAPWSYSCLGKEFSVCVDCWVPQSIANRRIMKGRRSSGNSGVLDGGDCAKSLEEVVSDATYVARKKAEAGARARGLALNKAEVARRAMKLANSALGLVSKRDGSGVEEGEGGKKMVADDVELAFLLHRAMNSSPRISRNLYVLTSNSFPAAKMGDCSCNSWIIGLEAANPSLCRKIADKDLNKNPDNSCLENLVRVSTLDGDSSMDMDCSKPSRMIDDVGIRSNNGDYKENCVAEEGGYVETLLTGGEGAFLNKSINSIEDDKSRNTVSQVFWKQDKSDPPMDERCDGRPDRCLIKYRRRK